MCVGYKELGFASFIRTETTEVNVDSQAEEAVLCQTIKKQFTSQILRIVWSQVLVMDKYPIHRKVDKAANWT